MAAHSKIRNPEIDRAGEQEPEVSRQTDPIELVREAIAGIRYGVVQVIVQDGKVVQIDRTEKNRLV
ncbi:MAG: YezD family protein [Capsulimonadaceae bacterium]|nr:YezD family protein [Capsulimonadaceae bacterium]